MGDGHKAAPERGPLGRFRPAIQQFNTGAEQQPWNGVAFAYDDCQLCGRQVAVDTDGNGKLVQRNVVTWRLHRCRRG